MCGQWATGSEWTVSGQCSVVGGGALQRVEGMRWGKKKGFWRGSPFVWWAVWCGAVLWCGKMVGEVRAGRVKTGRKQG